MKKYIFSMMMAAMAAFTFTSCEDVPEPYTQPSKPDDSGTTDGTPTGTGTAADPFNSVAAIQYCQSLEAGAESDKEVYIKGKVQSIKEEFSSNYGNASFYIADDETSETFYVYRTLYLGNQKWTSSDEQIKVGDEVVICGKVMNYSGNTPETVTNKSYLFSLNGKTAGGDTPAAGDAKGTGTEADPFNSVAAQNLATSLEADKATEQEYYIKGKIQKFASNGEFSSQYGNASFYIADDETSEQFYIFRTYYFGGEKWKDGDQQLKVGDEVVVSAKLINYKGNTPETSQGGKLISINGKTSGSSSDTPSTPETPVTGEAMTVSSIVSGKTSSEDLPENSYGSQLAATESTWYSWKYNNVAYSGARICRANGTYTGCLQVQGNASDAAKQGFFFNSSAFSSDIKSITLVVKGGTSYDTPTTFSVYHGTAAHPTTDAIEATYTVEKGDAANSFTMTYDFSAVSSKYFTIWNNAQGALYIEKIIVTLK